MSSNPPECHNAKAQFQPLWASMQDQNHFKWGKKQQSTQSARSRDMFEGWNSLLALLAVDGVNVTMVIICHATFVEANDRWLLHMISLLCSIALSATGMWPGNLDKLSKIPTLQHSASAVCEQRAVHTAACARHKVPKHMLYGLPVQSSSNFAAIGIGTSACHRQALLGV